MSRRHAQRRSVDADRAHRPRAVAYRLRDELGGGQWQRAGSQRDQQHSPRADLHVRSEAPAEQEHRQHRRPALRRRLLPNRRSQRRSGDGAACARLRPTERRSGDHPSPGRGGGQQAPCVLGDPAALGGQQARTHGDRPGDRGSHPGRKAQHRDRNREQRERDQAKQGQRCGSSARRSPAPPHHHGRKHAPRPAPLRSQPANPPGPGAGAFGPPGPALASTVGATYPGG